MAEDLSLTEHWHDFLLRNPDASLVVHGVVERTGFTQDEVLFFLMDEWAARSLTPEQQHEFNQLYRPPVHTN